MYASDAVMVHSEKYLPISMKNVYKTKEKRVWFGAYDIES